MLIDIECYWCGAVVKKRNAEIKRQIRKGRKFFFCSLSCGANYRNSIRNDKLIEVTKECLYCRKKFKSNTGAKAASYCSRSCASKGSMNEYRRNRQSEGGKANAKNLLDVSITLKKREFWKYEQIKKLLDFLGKDYEFEYRINDNIYNLALFEEKILIEFDGRYHNAIKQKNIDKNKEKVASQSGWEVKRVNTTANSVIPPDCIHAFLNRR